MPTLEFKGKAFVHAHHLTVPFRELVIDPKRSLPASGAKPSLADNLIIHGDNLHALKALLPVYAGKVDCIYIDPPYNTGNEGWCYNDNVRSPLMREWLKKASPVDKEDLERHDKWLCMMWPRLKLLHELLTEDGVVLVSIDDNENHSLRQVLDEVFSRESLLATFVWRRRIGSSMSKDWVSADHEYVVAYSKETESVSVRGAERDMSKYNISDGKGRFYASMPLTVGMTKEMRPNQWYELKNPKTGKGYWPPPGRVWGFYPPTMQEKIKAGLIIWPEDYPDRSMNTPRLKTYPEDAKRERKPISTWLDHTGRTEEGTKVLKDVFGDSPFAYPKPLSLVSWFVEQFTSRDALVLDSFAGSGTTAHAVLALNRKDGGNRRFILIECEDYADKLTAERVRRVIQGYKFEGTQREELLREPLTWTKLQKADALVEKAESVAQFEGSRFDKVTKSVEDGALVVTGEKKVTEKIAGLGGSFTFCTLGEELSLDALLSDGLPSFEALAKYVFFTATGRTLEKVPKPDKTGLARIGETDLHRVWLLYRPDSAWLRSNDAALTESRLDALLDADTGASKRRLIFAAAKFMSQRELSQRGVDFCQLPYAIHRILGE
jgi:adenine-specific DNA-methyltransferase